MGGNVNDRGSSRKHITRQIEDSLARLKTDFVDIYFLHGYDSDTPIEEVLRTMDDLVRQGKVLYIGASNFSAWQTAKALGISARLGLSPIHCIQPMYNLVKRTAEIEILPLALAENLGVVCYNPLGAGLLTGKYFNNRTGTDDRLNRDDKYKVRYGEEWTRDAARRFYEFAKSERLDPAALAIAWVMKHPAVTAPLLGARTLAQLAGCLAALEIDMTDDLYAAITALSVAVPPATDRNDG
jgi:aryl-alcohol dehydrogenase-like predicted oxidoreductase